MDGYGDDGLPATIFDGTDRIAFASTIGHADVRWWKTMFHDTYGLTPEGVGDRLTASIAGDRTMGVYLLDGIDRSFGIKVDGIHGTADFWFHGRILDISGSAVRADEMFVPEAGKASGIGREFLCDATRLATELGLDTVRMSVAGVGRYAWLRCGLLPEQGSWDRIRREMISTLFELKGHLGDTRFTEVLDLLQDRNAGTVRILANLGDTVPSEIHGRYGRQETTLGRILLLEGNTEWYGTLDLQDKNSMTLLKGF